MWLGKKKMKCPKFLEILKTKYVASVSHTFVLHFNLNDHISPDSDLLLKEYLPDFLRQQLGINEVVQYSWSGGFVSKDLPIEKIIKTRAKSEKDDASLPRHGEGRGAAADRMNRFNQIRQERKGNVIPPDRAFPFLESLLKEEGEIKRAIIIEHADNLCASNCTQPQMKINTEFILRWAVDREIEDRGHIIILLTNKEKDIDENLCSPHNRIVSIRVPFPDLQERLKHIKQYLKEGKYTLETSLTAEALANLTSGLRLWDIGDLFLEACSKKEKVSETHIKSKKAEFLESISGGMLKVLNPEHGFEAVGGLDYIVNYLKDIVASIKSGDKAVAETGILLLGPPGTGKSYIAKALAKEAGFGFVEILNIRGKYVGESEKNLAHVLNLIRTLTPCCVFMDELDQGEASRGTNLDSGVSSRIFRELLTVMSDETLLGKVLWIGASNRPDLIDKALKRSGRFGEKILVLTPGKEARKDIFQKVFKHHRIPYEDSIDLDTIAEHTDEFTGADIEAVVRRAYKIAKCKGRDLVSSEDLAYVVENTIPRMNDDNYKYMTLLALKEITWWPSIPDPLPEWLEKYVDRSRKRLNEELLEKDISKLKSKVERKW